MSTLRQHDLAGVLEAVKQWLPKCGWSPCPPRPCSGDVRVGSAADGKQAALLAFNPPTLAMVLQSAQSKAVAARAAAEKAQAELTDS
jgi:hypothetical protein